MKHIVLFSMPTEANIGKLSEAIFPTNLQNKVLAYMPSNGNKTMQIYTDYWKNVAIQNQSKFVFVDNLLPEGAEEVKKIAGANILLITGGNTFELLNNLRQSKLDQAIKDFAQKDEFILGGFSAGAIILSPSIAAAEIPSGIDPEDLVDSNNVGITDLTGLNIIDFEIMPHYEESVDKQTLENYRKQTNRAVREITNEDVIVLNL